MKRFWRAESSRKLNGDMAAMVELTSENWEPVVRDGGLALVVFWAAWSPTCASFLPVLDRVSRHHTDLVFGMVNVDDEKELTTRFEIVDVPTLLLLRGDTVLYVRPSPLAEYVTPGLLAELDLEETIWQERVGNPGATVTIPAGGLVPACRIPPDLDLLPYQVEGQAMAAAESDSICPAATAAEVAISLRTGLQASYAMNEGSGLLIADQVGGHTLTLIGARWSGGFVGPGLAFSGFPASATTPGFLDISKNFSVSAWVWLADTSGWHTAISQDATEVSGFQLQYSPIDNAWAFWLLPTDSVNARPARAVAPQAPRIGEWQHLIGVHDATASQLRLYLNGRLADVAPCAQTCPATGSFVVGRGLFADAAAWFAGGIDQIRVWNRALSDAEALAVA